MVTKAAEFARVFASKAFEFDVRSPTLIRIILVDALRLSTLRARPHFVGARLRAMDVHCQHRLPSPAGGLLQGYWQRAGIHFSALMHKPEEAFTALVYPAHLIAPRRHFSM